MRAAGVEVAVRGLREVHEGHGLCELFNLETLHVQLPRRLKQLNLTSC